MDGKINSQNVTDKQELKILLENIKNANKVRLIVFTSFFLLAFTASFVFKYYIYWRIIVALFLLLISSYISFLVFERTKIKERIERINVIYIFILIFELTIILGILHYDGTLLIAGLLALSAYSLVSYFIFPGRAYRTIFISLSVIIFIIISLSEVFGIIISPGVGRFGIDLIKNYKLLVVNIFFEIPVMIVILSIVDTFSRKTQASLKMLTQKEKELEEAKGILEIKVKSRTQELEEEKNSLEQKIQERTKELQNKVGELEKFQKFSVGRELKMVELKQGVEFLKKELENLKK